MPFWRWQGQDLILAIHVQPGASQEGMAGLHGERLKIRIAAPAHDGQANRRLLGWLATQMDLPVSRLELLQGAGSRAKRIVFARPLPPWYSACRAGASPAEHISALAPFPRRH
jgi:uncharacterized protein (TIGR00251 family)